MRFFRWPGWSGRKSRAANHSSQAQPLKTGGHGDHWGCIITADRQSWLLDYIVQVANQDPHPRRFTSPTGGRALAAYSPVSGTHRQVRLCVLAENNEVVSAYPEALGGALWPVEITDIVPWANGLEGQIEGICAGSKVSFFDTRFYTNQRIYRKGATYNFHINGFAYVLRRAEEMEFEIEGGAKVSWQGAHAYIPAGAGNPDADIDDYWFHSPLEGEVSALEFVGDTLQLYPVTLAVPYNFELSINLYAAGHTLVEGMADVQPGDDLEGFLWLQGYLADDGR